MAALDPDQTTDGDLTIGGTSFSSSDYHFGTPPSAADSGSLPGHGIYPTNYVEMLIGDVMTADEVVMDMQPGEDGSTMGKIFKYRVSTSYDFVHFDAFGYFDPYHFKFAPPSHDAETGTPVPEPVSYTHLRAHET